MPIRDREREWGSHIGHHGGKSSHAKKKQQTNLCTYVDPHADSHSSLVIDGLTRVFDYIPALIVTKL